MRAWLNQVTVLIGFFASVWISFGLGQGEAFADGRTDSAPMTPSAVGEAVSQPLVGFAALEATSPGAKVSWQGGDQKIAKMVTRLRVPTTGSSDDARAMSFLSTWGPALGLDGVEYAFVRVIGMNGLRAVHLQQVHQGLPVYQRYVVVTLDDAGEVRSLSSDAMPLRSVDGMEISESVAKAAASAAVYHGRLPEGVMAPMSARQVVVADSASAVTAWHVQVAALPMMTPVDVLVDGRDGRVLLVRDSVVH
jgi:hypothetical protein